MKIKKLELYGFKSFVDRTVVHFDHDMLGIVGPNGCGKSNIVDAIRWCMGEQSARHLRGRSMEDVIFNGSESRPPNDFAEVTLTFDNDVPAELPQLPQLACEYREYGEIAVTRRLHRSGDSDYLINKTPVRLRDVTDLFLGTGAGTKAYSIVEQGKIGLIVSARPEDRRLLIEEAAGITKFKSRKRQAERKMELTQQNLLRVGDIVAEIERNVASLKRQAAKAERYVVYRNELEDLQLHEAAHRYLELGGWIKFEGGLVEQLSLASEEVRAALDVREAEIDAARLDAHAAEQVLERAQTASFGAENAVRAEEGAIERAKDRISSLQQREHQAEGEKREMAEQLARLTSERQVIERDVETFEQQEREGASRIAEEEAKRAELEAAHATADARVADRRQSIAKGQAQIASADAMLVGFERRRADMASRLERIVADRESLDAAMVQNSARAQELRRSVDGLRAGRVTTAAEKARLEQRLGQLRDQIHTQDRALDESRAELSRKRSRLTALEEMHARLDGVGVGTKALVGTREACILGLVADRIEAPPELTQALAGLLGTRLQDVVVNDLQRGVVLLGELAGSQKGRAAIVPVGASFVAGAHPSLPNGADDGVIGRLADRLRFAPEDEALVRALVGDAVVVADLASAIRLRDAGARAPLVTVDGAVLHADGRIAGGQGDAVAAGMLESKREARELAKEIERLEVVATHRFEALQISRGEIAAVGAALDSARHEVHTTELAAVTAENDLQKAEERIDEILSRLAALAAEEKELLAAIQGARDERDEVARALAEFQGLVEAAEREFRNADLELAEACDRLDSRRQVETACKVAIAGTREKLAAAAATAARFARSVVELEERAKRLDEELVANARSQSESAAQLEAHEVNLQELLDRLRVAQDDLGRARAEFDRQRMALVSSEAGLKDLRTRSDGLRDELQVHELALREKQIALEHLLGGVADRFRGLRLPLVVGDYHLRAAPDEVSRARIDELSRLIERMGSVNLDAMREHEENQRRYEFYTTQKADLEKALSDLTRAIQQMNRESRRMFQETFDAVNARFREIFPRMFRGGRAELRMTSPEDLLETGIDIVAQPPGKKLSNIELMSGGEKALTAVSLIFAIFQIKPSPFCILDEVDAPLDEANVARYNEMVRSMTDRSQFILITHSKRTMELADVLYGVTMGEPGVSKIVSVKINGAESKRLPSPEGLPSSRTAVA
jgi:chromosome segregation protein